MEESNIKDHQYTYPLIVRFRKSYLPYKQALYVYKEIIVSVFLSISKFIHISTEPVHKIDSAILLESRERTRTLFQDTTRLDSSLLYHRSNSNTDRSLYGRTANIPRNLKKQFRAKIDPHNRLTRAFRYLRLLGIILVDNSFLLQTRALSHKLIQEFSTTSRLPKISWLPKNTMTRCSQ